MTSKACTRCGETKPLDEFPPRNGRPGSWCRDCQNARVRAWQQKRRAELGEQGWRDYRRAVQARHRAKTGGDRWMRAQRAAVRQLIAAHPDEYERLYAAARQQEQAG